VPLDTRALLALSDLTARLRVERERPVPTTVLARRRVAVLAAASVGAGLVCGLVVPVDATSTAVAAPASHRTTVAATLAVLLVSSPSPFTAATVRRPDDSYQPDTAVKPATVATKPRVVSPASPATALVADPLPARAGSVVALGRVAAPAVTAAGAPAYVPTRALPSHSGSGRRIVYSERAAHLWVVGADGSVIRDYPVTGRVGRPKPGSYHVYAKSTVAINPGEKLRFEYMVRFAVGITGARIGFHTIPRYYDGVPIQKDSQLGTAIGAGGCVRQSRADAVWLYDWSRVGDTVVVRL
jgi:lipoprotein-anchoring transpeptidase ErfK/SrfK